MINIPKSSNENLSFSLLLPSEETPNTIIFVPGMACNKFGHPFANEPQGVVADIVNMSRQNYKILFTDIHDMHADTSKVHTGKTVDFQAEKLAEIFQEAFNGESPSGRVIFIGQSLGALAIAKFISEVQIDANEIDAIFIAPPTYEGKKCHESLTAMFTKNENTKVDENCIGVLEFGDDQRIVVTGEYWDSIDRNRLSVYSESLKEKLKHTLALYAISDKYFSDNEKYLRNVTPDIERFAISGGSHTFKTDDMRQQVKNVLQRLL